MQNNVHLAFTLLNKPTHVSYAPTTASPVTQTETVFPATLKTKEGSSPTYPGARLYRHSTTIKPESVFLVLNNASFANHNNTALVADLDFS